MKLDVNKIDWEDIEKMPTKQKLVKKKIKDFKSEKSTNAKKPNNGKKDLNEDI